MVTDQIIHYTSDASIRVSIAITRELTEKARQCHQLSPVASAALGRTMTGALLLAGDYKNKEGVSILFKGDGPLGTIHVDSFDTDKVRGFVDHPHVQLPLKANGKLDVGTAVGKGTLAVTRFTPKQDTYSSQSQIVSGEIAEDLAYYLYTSEQISSTISLGILVDRDYTIATAGGFLVQALPGATDEALAEVENNIQKIGPITTYLQHDVHGEALISNILKGFSYKELYRYPVYWQCTCSQQRMERALLALRAEDKLLLLQDPQVEMVCHYCGQHYVLQQKELAALYNKTNMEV